MQLMTLAIAKAATPTASTATIADGFVVSKEKLLFLWYFFSSQSGRTDGTTSD